METMPPNISTKTHVSTLDVLWAFYQSQPQRVKKAFRTRMEAEKKQELEVMWKKDLKSIKALDDNWDEEGAPKISRAAIRNTQKLMDAIEGDTAALMRLYPTRLGAIMVKLETVKGRIKGEMGDNEMSYFVKRPGFTTEHHSFEAVNKENLRSLMHSIESIA